MIVVPEVGDGRRHRSTNRDPISRSGGDLRMSRSRSLVLRQQSGTKSGEFG
jgi:hypothetical protein